MPRSPDAFSKFIDTFKQIQDTFGERVDLTETEGLKNLPEYRRLDSLARLLESVTNCVAVSVFNGELVIATNKIVTGKGGEEAKQRNETLQKLILDVIKYFSDIARSKDLTEDDRKKVFHKICNSERFIALIKGSKWSIDGDDVYIIVEQILKGTQYTFEYALREFGRDPSAAAIILTCMDLYNDFTKLESSIRKAVKGDFSEFTEGQLKAFTVTQGLNILQTEESRYHAEMQIVFHILTKEKTRPAICNYYIGISKPCCLNCHAMLNVLNQNANMGVTFLVRSWHDKLGDSIIPREVLSLLDPTIQTNYDKTRRDKEQEVTRKKDISKSSTIKQTRSNSPASQHGEALAAANQGFLTSLLESIKKLHLIPLGDVRDGGDASIQKYTDAISTWLLFHDIESYHELFGEIQTIEEARTATLIFLEEAAHNEELKKCLISDEKTIFGFFHSDFFNSPIKNMVCQALSELFPEFKRNLIQQPHVGPPRV
jgi:hypothetical protein